MKLDKKITESSNVKSKDIDKKSILEILNIFNSEDKTVVKAVKNSLNEIHDIIDLTINSLICVFHTNATYKPISLIFMSYFQTIFDT